MRKLGSLVIIGLLLSTPFTIFVTDVAAAARAKGVIRDVNLSAGTVTIAARAGSVTLKTDERTEITRNGQPASIGDLQITDKAQAKYDSESLLAQTITATGGEDVRFERVEGAISAVGDRELTIVPMHEGAPVTLHISAKTYITLDGREAGLADLARGYSAGAMYNPESMDAVRVQAESFAEVRGIVRDVGVGTLTIATGEGDRSLTLNVAPGTPISLNDRPAMLEDLRRGFEVGASYVVASLQAVRIAATSRGEVQGLIRAVDLESATVTISPLVEGAAVQVHVTDSTVITVDGERAGLGRLQPGMPAQVVFNVSSFEAFSIAARSDGGTECTLVGVAGSIARVDVEGSHLVIHPAEGANDVTLNVTNRTEISLNDRAVRLSELRVGMRVEARFCRENQNATVIAAHSEDGGGDCTLVSASGVIARVDAEGGHLAVALSATPNTLTLNVTDRTEISLNGQPARLSDLRVEMRVEARFCRETLNATVIAAQSPTTTDCTLVSASGVIAGVDAERGHVAITTSTGTSPVYLNVTDRTEISLNGQPARLSDLRVGMRVEARFCRETLNATVIAAQSPTTTDCTLVSASGVIAGV
ncbi:MAG TPA: hypothetical protein VGV87_19130, partial [Blastocatellia bacterium]|nr:hypothetical protein [Blastocatellia bacterium]